jgi:predicted alpha-1,6-mannanase (GH76 family)
MTQGWDDVCGGGLWWNKDRGYKNAITNELFLLAAARLHRRARTPTGAGGYYDWAFREWNWFEASGMINAAHLVNDGLDASCVNNGGVTWSYNQGVILGGLVELWRISGDTAHLDRARQIADAAISALGDAASILKEPGEPESCTGDALIFKGIFVQGLARLYHADRASRPEYWTFLNANADSVWNVSRGWCSGVGSGWAGPRGRADAATQASACLLLGGIALLHAGGEATEAEAMPNGTPNET